MRPHSCWLFLRAAISAAARGLIQSTHLHDGFPRCRLLGAILLFAASGLGWAGSVGLLPGALPGGTAVKAIQLDASGNIYAAGSITPQAPKSNVDLSDAFVAKLSPDGSTLLYFVTLGGSGDDQAAAIAVRPDGSVYVTGLASSDFPVTAGALQRPAPVTGQQAFLAELNPGGSVLYAGLLGGTAGSGIAIDSTGAVLVSGTFSSAFPPTTGTVTGGPGGFLLKFDAALGAVLLSVNGYGGLLAFDSAGNIYIAGTAFAGSYPGAELPALPADAFQPSHASSFCASFTGPSGFAYPCRYQYVAKLNAAGTNVAWATYLTGTYGAIPAGIAVDSAGNVIVAGTTNSPDYPVTTGALETVYAPAVTAPPDSGLPATFAPAATGYLTKLNSTGTGLIWSTFFGGSGVSQIGGFSAGSGGSISISGLAMSGDLPGLVGVPPGCLPTANQALGFLAQVTADGSQAVAQLVTGDPVCVYGGESGCAGTSTGLTSHGFDFSGWPLAFRSDGTAVTGSTGGVLAEVDMSAANPRLACELDVTDDVQLSAVAPGQVISVFGNGLGPATPVTPPGGTMPSSSSLGVFFNGIPAPIIYASAQQVNVQVPYEIAGQTRVQMQVTSTGGSPPLSESLTLGVVEREPSVFLSADALLSPVTGYTLCGGQAQFGAAALALNADGTVNDCSNPAVAGSTATIFLNGMGVVTPGQSTGVAATAPAQALTPALADADGQVVIATTTVPRDLASVAQAQVKLAPQGSSTAVLLAPALDGAPLRVSPLFIWIRPN